MFVPAHADEVLPTGTPKAGTVDEINAMSTFMGEVETDAYAYMLHVQNAQHTLLDAQGTAVTKVQMKLSDRLWPGAHVMHENAVEAKKEFTSYAAEVDRIHGDADRVVTRVDEDLVTIRSQSQTITDIGQKIKAPVSYTWDVGAPGMMPDPSLGKKGEDMTSAERSSAESSLRALHELTWMAAATSWRQALEDIETQKTKWRNLINDRQDAERRLLRGLAATSVGQLIAISGGSDQQRQQMVATTISGELWGEDAAELTLAKDHPLLDKLIGSTTGGHVWDSPPDPDGVAAAWAKLSPDEQETLIREVPWVIGNLAGVPFGVRDRANRMLLDYYILHQDTLSPASNTALDEVMKALAGDDGAPPVSLVGLNLDGLVPMVAVGYGQLDTAKNLTWEVPGMLSDADAALPGWDRASKNLYAEQLGLLDVAGRQDEGNAVISFLSYDTPNIATVTVPYPARAGADRFATELDGTYATRSANTPLPNLAVLAHSYGTTMAANALTQVNHAVQSFTMVGSAGLDGGKVRSFTDLKVESDAAGNQRISTTMAGDDWLAPLGSNLSNRVQPNPQSAKSSDFSIDGAYSFSSDGDGEFKPTTGHDILRGDEQGYMDVGTQSLWNVAAFTTGEVGQMVGEVTQTVKENSDRWSYPQVPGPASGGNPWTGR